MRTAPGAEPLAVAALERVGAPVGAREALRFHLEHCCGEPLPYGLAQALAAELAASTGPSLEADTLDAEAVARLRGIGRSSARALLAGLEASGEWGVRRGPRERLLIPRAEYERYSAAHPASSGCSAPPAPPAARRVRRSVTDPHNLLGRPRRGGTR